MARLTEIGGKRLPFLRWSFLRMAFGMRSLLKNWQVGDGREAALAEYVLANSPPNDLSAAIDTVDTFCYEQSFMINVGDEKGELLDAAVRRVEPSRLLELGTYCGYSALRMASKAPGAQIYSIEFNADNASIARRIFEHAGVASRITVVVGTLGDGGKTAAALRDQHGFGKGSVDLAFVDHDKNAYLPDLKRILEHGWLRPGAVVVADNIKFPGAPDYREFMRQHEGDDWRTTEHETHAEYQTLIKDLVLESEYLGST